MQPIDPTQSVPLSVVSPTSPLQQEQQGAPSVPEQAEDDGLDIRQGPRTFYRIVEERIEQVGGVEVLEEVVEERTEEDGQLLRSTFKRVQQQLGESPNAAEAAIGQLDPARIRDLLLDG